MFVPISDADVPLVVALMNRAYRSSADGWTSERDFLAGDRTSEALLRADLEAKPQSVFLKWLTPPGDAMTGCVWVDPLGGDSWYLGSLALDPAVQNAGLGRTLLSAAEYWVRAQGGKRIRMTVINVREALIAWYGRRGYQPTGETNPFPYGDNRFGTPLRDDLQFVVLQKRIA